MSIRPSIRFDVWSATTLPRHHTPWESTLHTYIDLIGPGEVMDAMTITRGRFRSLTTNAVRFFVGVCKRKHAESEGRLKTCTVCGKFVVLVSGDDVTKDYYHAGCKEPV